MHNAEYIAFYPDIPLGTLCITLARLWQSDRDGLQGVFLTPIAGLLARKTTLQTARVRLITDRRELCRGSLGLARETVSLAWVAGASVSLEALLVARTRLKLPGLVLIAAYGASGIDGLAHFMQGLCAEQTLAINLSIWFEVLARLSLLSLLPTSARFIRRTVSKRSADT